MTADQQKTGDLRKQAVPCQMRQIDGGSTCDRCLLSFDDGDTSPKCEPAMMSRMLRGLLAEADAIEAQAGAAVKFGYRKFRDQGRLARALELRTAARLVDTVKSDPELLRRVVSSASRPGKTKS